jgi:hypothetical protein
MAHDVQKGIAAIQQQLKELDKIHQEAMDMLNTVAGTERVGKWRIRTVALLTESVGEQAGLDFSRIQPGPSFTNDMVEEFTDLIDCYRAPLEALAKQLAQVSRPSRGG